MPKLSAAFLAANELRPEEYAIKLYSKGSKHYCDCCTGHELCLSNSPPKDLRITTGGLTTYPGLCRGWQTRSYTDEPI